MDTDNTIFERINASEICNKDAVKEKLFELVDCNQTADIGIPLACKFGIVGDCDIDLLKSLLPLDCDKLYLFVESINKVFMINIEQLGHIINNKADWEDYDMCLFSDSYRWVIGMTHNNKVTYFMCV